MNITNVGLLKQFLLMTLAWLTIENANKSLEFMSKARHNFIAPYVKNSACE